MYKIEYSKDIQKDLAKLPKEEVIKILNKIDRLISEPRPFGVEPLYGKLKGLYRIRSENYRIIYQVIDERLIVLVARVSHRKEVSQP